MFFLLGGNDKKARKAEKQTRASDATARVRDVFLAGRFPVVTTHQVEGRRIAKVLGLVCCRGYDSEEAFFGMAGRAMNKGAQAIVGYNENVAFHPDGSKYFSCFGTAVMFEYDPADPDSLPLMLQQKFRTLEPFRQLLPNGLLNNPGTRKTNQRMRLCQDNVAQHGKAGRDASCGRVGKYADKQLAGLMMAL